jgi:sarcosine oxidase
MFLERCAIGSVLGTLRGRSPGPLGNITDSIWTETKKRPVGGSRFDVAVIGAGVFGSWTAWHLAHAGKRVVLLDEYGPANSRASSGGESRIIRMGYGADENYTRLSMRALVLWKEFFARTGTNLFHRTGLLWIGKRETTKAKEIQETLTRCGVAFEKLDHRELTKRYPQFDMNEMTCGILEPESGALMARRSVQAVVNDAIKNGVVYEQLAVETPRAKGPLTSLTVNSGNQITAETYVFACGSWLEKLFPEVLGQRILPNRQEVFFFGVAPGDASFTPPAMPSWISLHDDTYGLPNLDNRGLKIAHEDFDKRIDPDTQIRIVSSEATDRIRQDVARWFPSLKDAPIVETRVCQYETTSNRDFIVDRHPGMENVWLVGGGSGHGFKHGPALGEYVSKRILGTITPEPRFSLATKQVVPRHTPIK